MSGGAVPLHLKKKYYSVFCKYDSKATGLICDQRMSTNTPQSVQNGRHCTVPNATVIAQTPSLECEAFPARAYFLKTLNSSELSSFESVFNFGKQPKSN